MLMFFHVRVMQVLAPCCIEMDIFAEGRSVDEVFGRVRELRRELSALADVNTSRASNRNTAFGEGLLQCIKSLSCIADPQQPLPSFVIPATSTTTTTATAPAAGPVRTSVLPFDGLVPEVNSSPPCSLSSVRGFERVRQLYEEHSLGSPGGCAPQVRISALTPTEDSTTTVRVEFLHSNSPVRGWTKCVTLRFGGKAKGKLDVRYISPDKLRKIRTRVELMAFAQKFNLAQAALDWFDFRHVYCICQTPHSSNRMYIECSYGLCGCNSLVHPECVGLGNQTAEDIKRLGKAVCPLCYTFLMADRDSPSNVEALQGKM